MVLLKTNPAETSETNKNDFSSIQLLYQNFKNQIREEVVYRRNGKTIDKLIEFDVNTGLKLKTTHYDYFNDKKIRSIDEYDKNTGRKIRTTNYVLYKSIDEYDLKTGKKVRTINFNVKDDSKISSVQEYDIKTGQIVTVSIYKRDGKTIGIVKNINPETGKVTNWINGENNSTPFNISKSNIFCYDNIKKSEKEDVADLIDDLYRNKKRFEQI